jgi:signal transduction histidine kinase
MKSRRIRYAVYGFVIASTYCVLLFVLHYAASSGTPGQLLREFPAAAILVFLSLPACLMTGYLLGAERDRRESATQQAERYRMQSDAIEEVSASLERSEEMKSMVAIAASELKHPLTSIIGYILTLREYWDKLDDSSKLEFIEYIKVSSSRLGGIANYLSRIVEPSKSAPKKYDESLNLEEVFTEVSSILEDIYAEKGVRVAVRFLDRIPPTRGDSSLFFDLIYNLLDICMRSSGNGEMVSAWCSFKDSRTTMHLRCHNAAIGKSEIANIKVWPPENREDETATLSMQYRLARGMIDEVRGELRMEIVGEHGFSFLITLRPT